MTENYTLKEVFHLPGLKYNLLSVRECEKAGLDVKFSNLKVQIVYKNKVVVEETLTDKH